jgi:hypothetical protein
MPERVGRDASYDTSIFFNCPFDPAYQPIFDALIFATFDCGYVPRCALEIDDAGQVRIEKILAMIRGCRLAVHDISRTELDAANQLPRFNMPFELGVFVGATRFGSRDQRRKICLILDRERYRFQKFISDIAGQDIAAHQGDPDNAIRALRAWLSAVPTRGLLPGGTAIVQRYSAFRAQLHSILAGLQIEPHEMTFADYANIVAEWLAAQPRATPSRDGRETLA